MKVAIVAQHADADRGGAERSICELASALNDNKIEAQILATTNPKNNDQVIALCDHSQGKKVSVDVFSQNVRKHLQKTQYDIIHSVLPFKFADIYQPRGGTYAETSIRHAASFPFASLRRLKKYTASMNSRRSELLQSEKELCRTKQGPKIIALSKYVAGHFKKHYNTPDERIEVIPNGVNVETKIDQQRVDRFKNNIYKQLGVKESNNRLLLLFCANNFRLKGLRILLRALSVLKRKNPLYPVYLIVTGRDKHWFYYKSLAMCLGINDRVAFMGWQDYIQEALSVIDVAVLPTFYDASSRFILEALAESKPVITSQFNGAVELFKDKHHGRIIEQPEDEEELINTKQLVKAITWFTKIENRSRVVTNITADGLREQVSIKRVARELSIIYETML